MFLEREAKFGGGGNREPTWKRELRRHEMPAKVVKHQHVDLIERCEQWLVLMLEWATRPFLARDERAAMMALRPKLTTAIGQLARLAMLGEIDIEIDVSKDLAEHVRRAVQKAKEQEETP